MGIGAFSKASSRRFCGRFPIFPALVIKNKLGDGVCAFVRNFPMLEQSKEFDIRGDLAAEVLARCDEVGSFSEDPGKITRTFLSEPMRRLCGRLTQWMEEAGLSVRLDGAGNLIGRYDGLKPELPVLVIGSHVDTVPDAGKYDGVIGVLVGVAAVKALHGRRLPFGVDVIAFSDEEGVRYRAPFLGSLAAAGQFDRQLLERTDAAGITMADAFRSFGLDPARVEEAAYPAGGLIGYVEVHIEQGPILETMGVPAAVVEAIAGQSRIWAELRGRAGHAGTVPMEGRLDALAAAAELVLEVERHARSIAGLRATVGALAVEPGASNVIPGTVRLSIDVRHAHDPVRVAAVSEIVARSKALADQRGVEFLLMQQEHYAAVPADPVMSGWLEEALASTGHAAPRIVSGAGHDAGVMARVAPMAMLFLRSPGGVSHHPDERVLPEDVAVGLEVLIHYLDLVAGRIGTVGGMSRPIYTVGVA
jgi:allantoate deiminase